MRFFFLLAFLFLLPTVFAINAKIEGLELDSNRFLVQHQYQLSTYISKDTNEPIQTTLTITDNNSVILQAQYTLTQPADLNVIFVTTWTPQNDGNHTLTATIDANDSNLEDNTLSMTIFVKKGVDLVAGGLFIPSIVLPNSIVNGKIFLFNAGDEFSPFFEIELKIDNNVFLSRLENPLGAGENRLIDFNFVSPHSGTHNAIFTIDPQALITEFSKANNVSTTSFLIGNFEDQNLTRAQIEEIIRQYFEQRVSQLKESYELCKIQQRILDGNLSIMATNYSSCSLERDTCNSSLSLVRNEQSTCSTNLSLASTNCETRLMNRTAIDENIFGIKLAQKEAEVSSAKDFAKQKGDLNIVLAGLLMVTWIGTAAYMVKQGKVL